MNHIRHPSNNVELQPPKGWDQSKMEIGTLPLTRTETEKGYPVLMSFWRASEHELKLLREGGMVTLLIAGDSHPPVALSVVPKEPQREPR